MAVKHVLRVAAMAAVTAAWSLGTTHLAASRAVSDTLFFAKAVFLLFVSEKKASIEKTFEKTSQRRRRHQRSLLLLPLV